eukprot:gene10351-2487_t
MDLVEYDSYRSIFFESTGTVQSLVVADIDGDGIEDIVTVGGAMHQRIELHRGLGNRRFAKYIMGTVDSTPTQIKVASSRKINHGSHDVFVLTLDVARITRFWCKANEEGVSFQFESHVILEHKGLVDIAPTRLHSNLENNLLVLTQQNLYIAHGDRRNEVKDLQLLFTAQNQESLHAVNAIHADIQKTVAAVIKGQKNVYILFLTGRVDQISLKEDASLFEINVLPEVLRPSTQIVAFVAALLRSKGEMFLFAIDVHGNISRVALGCQMKLTIPLINTIGIELSLTSSTYLKAPGLTIAVIAQHVVVTVSFFVTSTIASPEKLGCKNNPVVNTLPVSSEILSSKAFLQDMDGDNMLDLLLMRNSRHQPLILYFGYADSSRNAIPNQLIRSLPVVDDILFGNLPMHWIIQESRSAYLVPCKKTHAGHAKGCLRISSSSILEQHILSHRFLSSYTSRGIAIKHHAQPVNLEVNIKYSQKTKQHAQLHMTATVTWSMKVQTKFTAFFQLISAFSNYVICSKQVFFEHFVYSEKGQVNINCVAYDPCNSLSICEPVLVRITSQNGGTQDSFLITSLNVRYIPQDEVPLTQNNTVPLSSNRNSLNKEKNPVRRFILSRTADIFSIKITNSKFEEPQISPGQFSANALGWVLQGTAGIYRATGSQFSPRPNEWGVQSLLVASGGRAHTVISSPIHVNIYYTLSFAVAWRHDRSGFPLLQVDVRPTIFRETSIATFSVSDAEMRDLGLVGEFHTVSFNFTSSLTLPSGIELSLRAIGGGHEAHIDNVALTWQPLNVYEWFSYNSKELLLIRASKTFRQAEVECLLRGAILFVLTHEDDLSLIITLIRHESAVWVGARWDDAISFAWVIDEGIAARYLPFTQALPSSPSSTSSCVLFTYDANDNLVAELRECNETHSLVCMRTLI